MACRSFWCQTITWNNAGLVTIGIWSLERKIRELEIEIKLFSFKEMGLKTSAKRQPLCPDISVWILQVTQRSRIQLINYTITCPVYMHMGHTVPADSLSPTCSRPPTGTVLTTKPDMRVFFFQFNWRPPCDVLSGGAVGRLATIRTRFVLFLCMIRFCILLGDANSDSYLIKCKYNPVLRASCPVRHCFLTPSCDGLLGRCFCEKSTYSCVTVHSVFSNR